MAISADPKKEPNLTVGRRLMLTSNLVKQFGELLKNGIPQRTVYQALGVSETTYFRWLRDGREEIKDLPKKKWSGRARLVEIVEQATAIGEVNLLQIIRDAAPEEWQAAGWILERTRSQTYARRTRVDVTMDWPIAFQLLGLIRDHLITYEETAEEYGDDLAGQLFQAAGIAVQEASEA